MSDRDMQRGNCDAREHFEVKGESHYYDEEFCVNFRPLPTPPVDAPPAASPMTILTNALHDPRWNEQSTKDAREIAERARVEVDAYNRKDRAPAPAAPPQDVQAAIAYLKGSLEQLPSLREEHLWSLSETFEKSLRTLIATAERPAPAHIREMLAPAAPPQDVQAADTPTWAEETMLMINKLTPSIKNKAFDPDWFLLRQRLEQFEFKDAAELRICPLHNKHKQFCFDCASELERTAPERPAPPQDVQADYAKRAKDIIATGTHYKQRFMPILEMELEKAHAEGVLAEHKSHLDFEGELYATLVDPVAEGIINESEMRKQLLESARWYRQHVHDLETQLNELAAERPAPVGPKCKVCGKPANHFIAHESWCEACYMAAPAQEDLERTNEPGMYTQDGDFEQAIRAAIVNSQGEMIDIELTERITERLVKSLPSLRRAAQAERQVAGADVESLSAKFHEIYQQEAKRQGGVRHKDAYADLPENIKEFDRVLARYVLSAFSLPAERVSAEELEKLKMKWRELSEQPGLQRCSGRAGKVANIAFEVGKEVYAKCADELEAILRPTHTPEIGQ